MNTFLKNREKIELLLEFTDIEGIASVNTLCLSLIVNAKIDNLRAILKEAGIELFKEKDVINRTRLIKNLLKLNDNEITFIDEKSKGYYFCTLDIDIFTKIQSLSLSLEKPEDLRRSLRIYFEEVSNYLKANYLDKGYKNGELAYFTEKHLETKKTFNIIFSFVSIDYSKVKGNFKQVFL